MKKITQAEIIMEYFKNHPNKEISHPEVVDWAVSEYKKRTGTTREGMRHHNIDIIIAGTALEQNSIIVSRDKIFKRIQDFEKELKIENCAE